MKPTIKITIISTLTCLLLSVQTLNAYEDREELTPVEQRTTVLEKFDKNEDDRIALEEAFGGLKDNFEKHDLDDNGYIESEELDTLPQHPPRDMQGEKEGMGEASHKHILQRHDKNGDNQISLEEARGGMKRNFSKHDLDGDGFIAGDEFDTLPQHRPPHQKR